MSVTQRQTPTNEIRQRIYAECRRRDISVQQWIEHFVQLSALKLVDHDFVQAIKLSMMH